jgi:hypothetical protein
MYQGVVQRYLVSFHEGSGASLPATPAGDFGGDFPTKLDRIINRLKPKTGRSILDLSNPAQATPSRVSRPQLSGSTWELETYPTISVLRDYFHEWIFMLDMIHIL